MSMKIPAFWPDAAEVWFSQAETQFAICNVTVASQILDLICAPLAGDPYGVLRECLITLYTL